MQGAWPFRFFFVGIGFELVHIPRGDARRDAGDDIARGTIDTCVSIAGGTTDNCVGIGRGTNDTCVGIARRTNDTRVGIARRSNHT